MKKYLRAFALLFSFMCFTVNVGADDVNFDMGTNYIDTTGEIFNVTSSKFSLTGSWNEKELYGYDNKPVKTTNESGARAEWSEYPKKDVGKLEFYVWKSVLPDGDPEMKVDISYTGNVMSKTIDCSQGYSGWERIGVVDISDIFVTTTITASGKGTTPVCAIRFVKADDAEYDADKLFDKNSELMAVKKDSYKCLYNRNYIYFEDAAPTIINDKMMIPIRFVSENMGAEVLWDAADRSVTINKDGNSVVFKIDNTTYSVNGTQMSLEQAPVLYNSKTLLPIRALSEGLGYQVDWNDNGVVCIGKNIEYDDNKDKRIAALGQVLSR